jgi:hypothetical protein
MINETITALYMSTDPESKHLGYSMIMEIIDELTEEDLRPVAKSLEDLLKNDEKSKTMLGADMEKLKLWMDLYVRHCELVSKKAEQI